MRKRKLGFYSLGLLLVAGLLFMYTNCGRPFSSVDSSLGTASSDQRYTGTGSNQQWSGPGSPNLASLVSIDEFGSSQPCTENLDYGPRNPCSFSALVNGYSFLNYETALQDGFSRIEIHPYDPSSPKIKRFLGCAQGFTDEACLLMVRELMKSYCLDSQVDGTVRIFQNRNDQGTPFIVKRFGQDLVIEFSEIRCDTKTGEAKVL